MRSKGTYVEGIPSFYSFIVGCTSGSMTVWLASLASCSWLAPCLLKSSPAARHWKIKLRYCCLQKRLADDWTLGPAKLKGASILRIHVTSRGWMPGTAAG